MRHTHFVAMQGHDLVRVCVWAEQVAFVSSHNLNAFADVLPSQTMQSLSQFSFSTFNPVQA